MDMVHFLVEFASYVLVYGAGVVTGGFYLKKKMEDEADKMLQNLTGAVDD